MGIETRPTTRARAASPHTTTRDEPPVEPRRELDVDDVQALLAELRLRRRLRGPDGTEDRDNQAPT